MITKYNLNLDSGYMKSQGKSGDRELGFLDRETFFISEYISKHLRKKKLNCNNSDFKKVKEITINFSSEQNRVYPAYESSLFCDLVFKYSDIFSLRGKARTEKIMEGIAESVEIIKIIEPELGSEIENVIELFKKENYRNIWIHKTKRLKGLGLAKLECDLSALHFFLSLVVEDKNGEIFRKRVLSTRGDSLMYHQKFNNLKLTDQSLSILDRISSNPIYIITLDELKNNEFGRFPENDTISNTMRFDSKTQELVLDLKLNPRKTKWWDDFVDCFTNHSSTTACPDLSEF